MRTQKKTYGGTHTILYNVDGMEAHPVTVSNLSEHEVNDKGRKIVRAGTLVGGDAPGAMADRSVHVKKHNDEFCEGVLLHDVDITDEPMPGAMIYKGNINVGKIPEEPIAAALAKIPMVRFIQ